MLCVPPESITSASPRRMISTASPMAWLLAAQAVRQLLIGALGVEGAGQVPGRHVRLLLQFDHGVQFFQPGLGEQRQIELISLEGADHHAGEGVESLAVLRRCPDRRRTASDRAGRLRCPNRATAFLAAPMANLRVAAAQLPGLGIFADFGDVETAHLGRDFGGKIAGVEHRRVADARLAVLQPLPDVFDVGAHRRDQPMPVITTRRLIGLTCVADQTSLRFMLCLQRLAIRRQVLAAVASGLPSAVRRRERRPGPAATAEMLLARTGICRQSSRRCGRSTAPIRPASDRRHGWCPGRSPRPCWKSTIVDPIDQRVARHGMKMKSRLGDLPQDDTFFPVAVLGDQQSAGLRHALDDQRIGHHRRVREMVVQMLFGQRNIFDARGPAPALELGEAIDPKPTHGAVSGNPARGALLLGARLCVST